MIIRDPVNDYLNATTKEVAKERNRFGLWVDTARNPEPDSYNDVRRQDLVPRFGHPEGYGNQRVIAYKDCYSEHEAGQREGGCHLVYTGMCSREPS